METKRTYLLQILLWAFSGESAETARVGLEQTQSNALPEFNFEINQLFLAHTEAQCSKCPF